MLLKYPYYTPKNVIADFTHDFPGVIVPNYQTVANCKYLLKLQMKDKVKLQSISKKLSSEYSLLEQAKRFLKIFDEYENNNSNTSI